MKTEHSSSGESLWTNSVELLPSEECLPVIGSCQVSSILSNLGAPIQDEIPQNMELIILPNNDYKLPILDAPVNLQNNYVILKEPDNKNVEENYKTNIDKSIKLKKDENFEDILYFVCNLCPFLCTKDSKITEHLEIAHKNKPVRKLTKLKCPACPNTFYHKVSLRSHLIHDHGVGNSDLSTIIQAVVYYSNKNKKVSKKEKIKVQTIKEKVEEVTLQNDDYISSDSVTNDDDKVKTTELPQLDLVGKNTQIINTLMRQPDSVTKCIDSKNTTKCDVAVCKVRFEDVDKLGYHVRSHIETGFRCLECSETFLYWKTLMGHLWRQHKIDMGLFSCDKCDYKTYSLAKLNNIHKLIHSDVKSFRCEDCDKAFKNVKQLRNHRMTHKNKESRSAHECDVCRKSFADRRLLKNHVDVVHNKIRAHNCSYCEYKGATRGALKMHVRQHTGKYEN
ncbi:unnamed protein product [Brassicogethes aeneus]|uniref:C2H2-type domain-containing protein n=1 Tax=Brassicogethes aeneus TaxID=1431903 RepID=A0A9P0AYJ1_BRAAE|nr:unnamed protein product [Brassicogethes aeneus]